MHNTIIQQISAAVPGDFSGCVLARIADQEFHEAFGDRDRANRLPNDRETAFGIASGTKGFTAIAIMRLLQEGKLEFDTPAHKVLNGHVQNINPEVTIRHLLQHNSGVGDYLDEEEIEDFDAFELDIPANKLLSPLDYMPLLEEKLEKFPPGSRFSYSNSGYIILAIIVELLNGKPYQEVVESAVFAKAGMTRSGFYRSDALPANVALGYVQPPPSPRTNVFHLPIRGGGDGGAYSTPHDMALFWQALMTGKLIEADLVTEMTAPQQSTGHQGLHYGLGFWIDRKKQQVSLIGSDAGVSFQSTIRPSNGDGFTVISNTPDGAWSLTGTLNSLLSA